jgi:hypothetical protein
VTAPASGGIYARGELVPTSFACSEGPFGPGLARCTDSNGVAGGASSALSRAGTGKLNTRKLGAHTYSVIAVSSDGLGGRAQIHYTVAAPPAITIASPAEGATYALGQLVKTHYRCKDGVFGPGIRSCTVTVRKRTVPRGQPVDTLTLGRVRFIVTAVSKDGQQTTQTVSYKVSSSVAGGPNGHGVTPGAQYVLETGSGPSIVFPRLTAFHNAQTTCTPRPPLVGCRPAPGHVTLKAGALPTSQQDELAKWRLAYVQRKPSASQTVQLVTQSADGRVTSSMTLSSAVLSKLKIVGAHTSAETVTVTITMASVGVKGLR